MGGISSRALYPSEGGCNITEGNNGSLVNTGKAVFSSNETTKLEEDEYGISATEPRETSKDRELFKDNLGESDHLDISRNGCSTSGEVLNLGHFDNQSIPTTSVLGNDGYKDSLDSPEAVLWRRGPLLGKGAFGSVWLALQENDGTLMAVKTVPLKKCAMRTSEVDIALERDMGFMSQLHTKTELHIFMEYVPGGSLDVLYQRFGPLPENASVIYIKQILSGLNFLHSHGIIHMDVKAANVLVDANDKEKFFPYEAIPPLFPNHSQNTQDPHMMSASTNNYTVILNCHEKSVYMTTFWAAPEVLKGEHPTAAADIWSCGCTGIELLTGSRPWPQYKSLITALYYILSAETTPELPQNLTETAASFIRLCLTIDPMERPCASEVLRHNFFTLSTPELRKIRSSVLNRKTTTKRKQQLNCSGNGHSGTSLPSTMNRECSNNGLLCNINMAPTYNVIDHNSPAGREDAESTKLGDTCSVYSETVTSQFSQGLTVFDDVSTTAGVEFACCCDDDSTATVAQHGGQLHGFRKNRINRTAKKHFQ